MRTASKILAIMGGVFAIIFAVIFLLISLFLSQIIDTVLGGVDIAVEDPRIQWGDYIISYDGKTVTAESDSVVLYVKNMENLIGTATGATQGAVNIALYTIAGLSLLGGLMGIYSGVTVHRKNTSAGILMVCAGLLSLLTVIGIYASLLLIVGGFFAVVPLRPRRKNEPDEAPPDKKQEQTA